MATVDPLISALKRALGSESVRDDTASRLVYARDASHQTFGRPACVVLPRDVAALRRAIACCREHRRPFVARGMGTGLSGGALPADNAVVIAVSRLDALGGVDPHRRNVRVETGVLNDAVSRHAAPYGLHFAPDPSSQSAASIGGNVAENAGGPHCLALGVTGQHVRKLEWIDSSGHVWQSGRGAALERGLDLRGLLIGSEGTLGVVTAATLDLQPIPPTTAVLLAEFPRLAQAAAAVVTLMGSGLVPAACEIVDRVMLEAVEGAFSFGFATDVEAVMICELAGPADALDEDTVEATAILRDGGARAVQRADDADEKARLWTCRKKAFGAVGRLAPAYISMDVVVPLAQLTTLVGDIQTIKAAHGVEVATAFHAGDGNLHPGIHYDPRDAEVTARAHRAADAIVERALALGGSCTGEHGVGIEKRHLVHRQLDPVALRLMHGIKQVFDPDNLCNPGKALPEPGRDGLASVVVPTEVSFAWDSLAVTAPASTSLAELQAEALGRGLWIPVGGVPGASRHGPGLGGSLTVGELISAGTVGPSLLGDRRPTDAVLELWAETGSGDVFKAGAPVLKNVAGYDLVRLLVGSDGVLASPRAATFLLRPAPAAVGVWSWPRVPWDFTRQARREFLTLLRRRSQPAMAVRERTSTASALWLLTAGRDRPWDLDALAADLASWSEDHGLARPDTAVYPTVALTNRTLLNQLPAWCRSGPDWTLLTRREGWPEWPDLSRLIWHTHPDVLWTPDEPATEPVGWHADTIFRGGVVQPLPAPPAEVPRLLIAALKHLFDPNDRLPRPGWLGQARPEAAS